MSNGSISYSATIDGLVFGPIEITTASSKIENLSIESQDNALKFSFLLTDVFDKDEALLETSYLTELIADRISFQFARKVENIKCDGWSLPVVGNNRHVVVRDFALVWDVVNATITPGEETLYNLKLLLESPIQQKDTYFPQFRFACSQRDPVTKYMFLYNLLLLLHNDKQARVDAYILNVEPNTPVFPSPIKDNVNETIYTKLRNEVAHTRLNASASATVKEIQSKVNALQIITKKCIEQQA
ncbi:MAG: hypothetical protein ACH255_08920 [Candidatus Thiodiazotropha sp.]